MCGLVCRNGAKPSGAKEGERSERGRENEIERQEDSERHNKIEKESAKKR